MKKLIFFSSITLSFFAHADWSRPTCAERVTTAARSIWSVNSGIEMKNLIAEIRGTQSLVPNHIDYVVDVSAPKFPQTLQKVPYIVTVQSTGPNGTCFIKTVIAQDNYGL